MIEYNVRFGDPETQVVLPLLASDPAELLLAVADGALDEAAPPAFADAAAVCVVLAAPGYPESPRIGDDIEGLTPTGQSVAEVAGTTVFHAGTARQARAARSTRRAGASSASPPSRHAGEARANAYAAAAPIEWEGMQLRHDIAAQAAGSAVAVGEGPMIPRYSPEDMAALFSDAARFSMWLEVELLATEAQAALGFVPADEAATCRAKAPTVDDVFVADVLEREKVTDHDVAAFVDVVQDRIGAPAGSWIHYGLTSSDVVDTALCATLTKAADLLLADLDAFVAALKARALELLHVPVTGRTHGMHAEPTTFGAKFALWALQADRDRRRLRAARDAVAVGKLSGAVGTFSNIDPAVEAEVCAALGLTPVPATQVIARDRHAEYFYACAAIGARSSSCAPRSATSRAASSARWRSPSAPARRAARPCRTSATRSSPSGCAGWPACCAATSAPGSRTWPCGTSATSRTARSSGSRCPTPRCSPVTSCARRPAWPRGS